MNRKCIIIKSSKEYGSSFNRHICIDFENKEEIFACIQDKRKKFSQIIERTLTQRFIYWDCYAKEKADKKSKNVAAIKFFDVENTRIYCQELSTINGHFYIICAVALFSKKVQKNDKRIVEIIKKVASYRYEIE